MQYLANKFGQAQKAEDIEAQEEATGNSALQEMGSLSTDAGFQSSGFSSKPKVDDARSYREDFGWKMTNEQYDSLVNEGKKFNEDLDIFKGNWDKELGVYKSQQQSLIDQEQSRYSTEYSAFQKSYNEGKASIDKAKSSLGKPSSTRDYFSSWWKNESKRIQIKDGDGNVEGTYYAPKSMINELNKGTGKDTYSGAWEKGGYSVYVWRKNRGDVTAAVQQMADKKKVESLFWNTPEAMKGYRELNKSYYSAKDQIDKATNAFNTNTATSMSNFNTWKTNIGLSKQNLSTGIESSYIQRDKEIALAQSSRQGKIDAAAQAYQDRRTAIASSYANLV